MPRYEYRCKACGARWEAVRPVAERHWPKCPECGGDAGIVPAAPVLAWSQASADGGRPNYRERVRIPDTD